MEKHDKLLRIVFNKIQEEGIKNWQKLAWKQCQLYAKKFFIKKTII